MDFEPREPSPLREWLRDSPSWLASLVVHMAVLLILALLVLPPDDKRHLGPVTVSPNVVEEEIVDEVIDEQVFETNLDIETEATFEVQPETEIVSDTMMMTDASDVDAATPTIDVPAIELDNEGGAAALVRQVGAPGGTGLKGRGAAARKMLAAKNGASPDSELAVALALKWLAEHQMPDGGWNYDHRLCPACGGKCDSPGELVEARNGATAMALLPFLGAGQTHMEGKYKETVGRGLYYLARSMKVNKKGGGSWKEPGGTMYAHGLASIVMCEAYGMTQDRQLAGPAQAAANYIMQVQDPVTGGWGYGGPGRDTSVAGWQIMALKSAHMAYLYVDPRSVRGIDNFLNLVQADSGASYGYTSPGRGPATTAVGLLCRMYMGWKADHPALQRAMLTMADQGPNLRNLYRDYYAAQFMFQVTGAEGEVWDKWNTKMRDGLIATQARQGHMEGSWNIASHNSHGGRILSTCLATLILEVYYRHMPIHREEATKTDFPLD